MKSRVSLLDEQGDIDAPLGSREWAVAVARQAKLALSQLDSDVQQVQDWLRMLKDAQAWQALGYASFGLMVARELNADESQLEAILSAKPGTLLAEIPELGKHGGDRRSEEAREEQDQDGQSKLKGSGRDYWLARMKRDRPDLIERLEEGEFPSVRQAAIEAGIVKVKTSIEQLQHWWGKAGPGERVSFIDWLQDEHGYTIK